MPPDQLKVPHDCGGSPTVSAIVPVFNREEYLRAAVTSVFAQTFANWELIIADDGSDDGTRSYLRTLQRFPRVSVLWLAHSGNPAVVRNAALQAASGEFVAFLDSDDEWLPDKLTKQVELLRKHPERQWCCSTVLHIDAHGNPLPRRPVERGMNRHKPLFEQIVRWETAIPMPTVMVRRDLLERVGGFDEQQLMHEDCDLWLKLARESDISYIDSPLSRVRHHGNHYSARGEQAIRDWIALFEKWQLRVEEPGRRHVLTRQCARCTVILARHYAVHRDAASMFRTLAGNARRFWKCPEWWTGSIAAVARLVAPAPLVGKLRRYMRPQTT
jgi:glycosyltransferase involved in cell wall biosynthesis